MTDEQMDILVVKICDAIEKKFDAKLDALEKKFDAKLDALEKKFDAKLDALEKRMNARFDAMQKEIDSISRSVAVIEIEYGEKIEALIDVTQGILEKIAKFENRFEKDEKEIENCSNRIWKLESLAEKI